MNFTNKVVLITGAASGIGAAIALSFAKVNATLCIIDINKQNLLKVKKQCEELSKGKVLEVVVDLTKDKDVKYIVEVALKEFKKIDVLVNCAGVIVSGSLEDPDVIEKYDKLMSVNIRASILLSHQALPALKETKGSIVNISSITSTITTTNSLAYNISKAAVTKFTKCAALDLARSGVRVNCISPGPVKTNILLNGGINEAVCDEAWKKLESTVPLNRCVKAEEIGELAVYLASDKAASITGADFAVDSGMLLGNITENSYLD